MDYSEQDYKILLKMRANGKMNYDEERYMESLKYLGKARQLFETTRHAYEKNNTEEFRVIAKNARDALEHARAVSTYRRDIMEGSIQDPKATDTMYELRGYKMMEECDEIMANSFGSQGYWMPTR